MTYWERRVAEQQDKLNRTTEKQIMKELEPLYKKALDEVYINMSLLLDKIEANPQKYDKESPLYHPLEMYKYNRFNKLQESLKQTLTSLGNEEVKVYKERFKEFYVREQELVDKSLGTSVPIDYAQSKSVIKSVWCADGKNWSDRIWEDKSKLASTLTEQLTRCVVLGIPRREISKEIQHRFNVSYHNANRLCRTELTYLQNQAALQRYKDLGIKQYKFVAELDERTSDICRSLNGNIYNIDNAVVGVNIPPLHVNCRSGIVPVINTKKGGSSDK